MTSTRHGPTNKPHYSNDSNPPPASIRTYNHSTDYKFLRFLVGSSILSKTAAANRQSFWSNPIVYVWTILFTAYIAYSHLDPTYDPRGNRGASRPHERPVPPISIISSIVVRLPIFVAPPLILLLLLNWSNKSYFNSLLIKALSGQDLRDPVKYYSSDHLDDQNQPNLASSAIWVLDYNGRQLGMIALDRNVDELEELSDQKSTTMLIRHLAVATDFKAGGIDYELLRHAISIAFSPDSSVVRLAIRVISSLDPFQLDALIQLGFRRLPVATTEDLSVGKISFSKRLLGLLGWPKYPHCRAEETWICDRRRGST